MQDNFDEELKRIAQQKLKPAIIVDVISEKDEGMDGDPILRISIVFEAEQDLLDPKKVISLVRYLRDPINSLPTLERFPILSFMTPEEVKDATA